MKILCKEKKQKIDWAEKVKLTDNDCKYPIGHPKEKDFYFCGRTSLKDFSYCKLHLLYSYQSKNKKEEPIDKGEIPEFIEKKIKSA